MVNDERTADAASENGGEHDPEQDVPSSGRHAAPDGDHDGNDFPAEYEAGDPLDAYGDGPAAWMNVAESVQAYIDDDDPFQSFLETMVYDVDGDLGQARWPLGPLQLGLLMDQLAEVQEAQEFAQFVAAGGDPNRFVPSAPNVESERYASEDGYDDEHEGEDHDEDEDEDEDGPARDIRKKVAKRFDPMNISGLLKQAPEVMGIKAHYWLVMLAILVGVVVVVMSRLL